MLLLCRFAAAALPSDMRAGALTKRPCVLCKVDVADMKEIKVKVPTPGKGEILVQVEGSSVNPIDYKEYGMPPFGLNIPFPHVLGSDCGGVVVALGEGAARLNVGDKVWADNKLGGEGCFAEYAVLAESIVSVAPSSVPLADAATLPLVALTALDALQKFAGAPWPAGKTVVVLGGSGGVGNVGVQLAKAWGATHIIATCGTSNVEFCKSLGADQVIDYHKAQFYDVIPPKSVDVVFDTVGIYGTGSEAFDILKDGGFHATTLPTGLANPMKQLERWDVSQKFILTDSSDYKDLDVLTELVNAGQLKPHVGQRFTIAQAGAAFNASMGGHSRGKISVTPGQSTEVLV